MLRLFLFMPLLIISGSLNAQIISQFSFDVDPVTNADVGPNATGISSSAFSGAGGVGGTNGLNAGLPKLNINMVIPTDASFDTPGIDVSFDSHREESAGTFWQRGNSLRIVGCSNLSVSYRVDNGGGGFNTVNSGNVFSIPNDDTYRSYRFFYTDCDGVGVLMVDGVSVWTNDGPDNRAMYWIGAGNVTVGNGVDATGSNKTFFDNLVVGAIGCSPLPVELTSFNAKLNKTKRQVDLFWSTASELESDYFIIQRSDGGEDWVNVSEVNAAGNSSVKLDYQSIDQEPLNGESYYRVKQIDVDGESAYSPAVRIDNLAAAELYPNPVEVGESIILNSPLFRNESIRIDIYNAQGLSVYTTVIQTKKNEPAIFNIPEHLAAGGYVLKTDRFSKKLFIK
jgi:hypothetical protein